MHKTIFSWLLVVFSVSFLRAQISDSESDKLTQLLTERVNKLRLELDKTPLKNNVDLSKAAKLHSKYIAKKGKLSHTQSGTDFPQPKDRVAHYNKAFVVVGENILYSKPVSLPLTDVAIKKLAFDMFRTWKNSPGHYKNMIFDNYNYSGFAFEYNAKSKRVFATHVLGKKGYVVPKQLSDNAFLVKNTDQSCVDLIGGNSNVIVNIGNQIVIENDEVFLKYHNVKIVKDAIYNANDGLAIDLVDRDQLLCQEDNILDVSPIYDGIMLQPVFRDQLFSNNLAKNKNRLVVSMGKVPEHLKGKSISPNIIFLKNNKKCSYAVPSNIPSKKYSLKFVNPIIYEPNIALKTKGVMGINSVQFNFDTGKINPVTIPVISFQTSDVHSVDIKSFTSIDGNHDTNNRLHNARAHFIKTFIREKVSDKNLTINVNAKENWDLCYYQLELSGLDEVLGDDKAVIRDYVKQKRNGTWKDYLEQQRQSKAIFYQYGDWLETASLHLNYNLIDALLTNNYELANKALAEMYKSDTNTLFFKEEFIIDYLFTKKELVQNVAALLLKDIEKYDLDNVVYFVRNWLSKPELLSETAQKNLLNLYNITSRKLLSYWDSDRGDFSKILHPKKVELLFNNYKSKDVVNPIFLNFHMTSIDYYGQVNYSDKIVESFDFITSYFRDEALTIQDDIALSLFFNRWSSYDLTIELLWYKFRDGSLNEEASFILAKTYVAYDKDLTDLIKIHKAALKFNKKRWCQWINTDFQNLRNESVKNLYCNTCNN